MKKLLFTVIILFGISNSALAVERYVICESASTQLAFNTPSIFEPIELRDEYLNIRRLAYDRVDNELKQIVVTYNGSDHYLNASDLSSSCNTTSNLAHCSLANLPSDLNELAIYPKDYTALSGQKETSFNIRAKTKQSKSPNDVMINITPIDTERNCKYSSFFEQG